MTELREQPPVLSDEQIDGWCKEHQKDTDEEYCSTSPSSCYICLCQAQRDADYKHQWGVVREIFEEIEANSSTLFKSYYGVKVKDYKWQSLKDRWLKEKK